MAENNNCTNRYYYSSKNDRYLDHLIQNIHHFWFLCNYHDILYLYSYTDVVQYTYRNTKAAIVNITLNK